MTSSLPPDDARLRALLNEARPSPSLRPRFKESVWKRIEGGGSPTPSFSPVRAWLERWVDLLLAPRLALSYLAVVLLLGAITGVRRGVGAARQQAQERYLSSVAPGLLR